MEHSFPWLGNLYDVGLEIEWVGLVCLLTSTACGVLIGLERERRDKPAGLRTVTLIAVGSTIFTMVSLLLAERKQMADPARLAAQIIPGVGFLGAGAIIQARGTVVGLTTGATIWAVAAVGVTIGGGYVVAGACFTGIIFLTLTVLQRVEHRIAGACRFHSATIHYEPDRGKSRPRLQAILDQHHVPEERVRDLDRQAEGDVLEVQVCTSHREHRRLLKELADFPPVVALKMGDE